MQNFSDLVQREHLKLGLNGWVGKNVRFSTKTGHISETVKDGAKVAVDH